MVDRVHINRTFDWRRALPNAREHGTLGDDAQRFGSHARGCHQTKFKEIIEKYFVPETYELRWPEKAKDLESERAVQAVQPLDIMIRTRFECEKRHVTPTLVESIIGVRPGHAHHGKRCVKPRFSVWTSKRTCTRQSRRSQVTQLLLRTPRTGRLIERRLRSSKRGSRRITKRDHKLPAVFEARAWINPPWQLKSFWGA